jgi:hypothetical protein
MEVRDCGQRRRDRGMEGQREGWRGRERGPEGGAEVRRVEGRKGRRSGGPKGWRGRGAAQTYPASVSFQ